MAKSPIERAITFKGFEDVEAGIVKWPMSVIRIKSSDRKKLVDLSVKILDNWRKYNDESLDIIAFSGDTPHNTITPIGRRRGKDFELDLVLRNNRTNEKYPLGIFHPHEDVHNIKKENIGLIEVMGLAVLPGRLKEELEILEKYMLEPDFKTKIKNDPKVVKHLEWAINIQEKHVKITSENIKTILKDEIGVTFSRVLEDAGVYKLNNEGEKGLLRFIEYINMN